MDQSPMQPMGSVAALINPLDKGDALLFYCGDTYNLAVEHRPLVAHGQMTTYTDNNVVNGNITQPGDFATVLTNNLIKCYGITNFTATDKTLYNVVSAISPSSNPIDNIQNGSPPTSDAICGNYSALAATSDVVSNDYVCFIRPDPTNSKAAQLIEYTIYDGGSSNSTFDSEALLPSTRLTTCLRTDDSNGNRFIFAQMKQPGNPIGYLSTDTRTLNPIPPTNNAAPGNPFAVTTATVSGKMNMYLFYMDNTNSLMKVVYNGTWGPSNPVAGNLQAGSGITVVNDGQKCYAFYAKTGAKTYTMWSGPL